LQLNCKSKRSIVDARRRDFLEKEERNMVEECSDMPFLEMQLQEDRINEDIMREREEEIRNINKGMHQVNEIYKDLAQIVEGHQYQIDEIGNHMGDANKNAENGLIQFEKANEASENSCVIS